MTDRINEFVQYLEENGVAVNTRQSYERDLRLMMKQLQANGVSELADIGLSELMQYIDQLQANGRTSSTISRNIASIRRFFKFTKSRGYTFSNPSELLKAPKVIRRTPEVLSEREVKRIIAAVDSAVPKGMRDRAIIELIASAGLGVSEVLELKTEDVDLKERTLTVGSRRRSVALSRHTAETLKIYADVRHKLLAGNADCGAFFLSCAGDKITRQGLWKIIHVCGINAGMDNVTPQLLRHSFAVSAIRRGKDVGSVQKALGHASRAGALEYRSIASARA